MINIFEVDTLLLVDSTNCLRFAGLYESVTLSHEWTSFFNEFVFDLNPVYNKLRPFLTDGATFDSMSMTDVCTYVYWANYHNIALIPDLTETDIAWCTASMN